MDLQQGPTTASRCASGSTLVTKAGCWTMSKVIDSCIINSCCLPRWMSSERRGEAFISEAGDTPARYDKGAFAKNHKCRNRGDGIP